MSETRIPEAPNFSPSCESCGEEAGIVCADGSTWCWECHVAALRGGYDADTGTVLP